MSKDYELNPVDSRFISFTKTWHTHPYAAISPKRTEVSAAGKNVIITGGGTGIGKAIAKAFAQAGAASVTILGRRLDRLQTSSAEISAAAGPSTQVLFEVADVSKFASIKAALDNIVAKTGKINVFVSNAGVMRKSGTVADFDEADVRYDYDINVFGAMNAIQAFLPHAAPGACLFNTSSCIGHVGYMPGVWSYAGSKAAAIKMFEYVAAENPDLHVVSIHPGVVSTEINAGGSTVTPDSRKIPLHPSTLRPCLLIALFPSSRSCGCIHCVACLYRG
jgi:NAD(P)-dependent dehydrogenase (short-subunit alcohol dehydrogenase family)